MGQLGDGELDLSWVDPEIEWDASCLGDLIPDLAEVYRGHDGVRTYWEGKLVRWRTFPDQQSALEAVGLPAG